MIMQICGSLEKACKDWELRANERLKTCKAGWPQTCSAIFLKTFRPLSLGLVLHYFIPLLPAGGEYERLPSSLRHCLGYKQEYTLNNLHLVWKVTRKSFKLPWPIHGRGFANCWRNLYWYSELHCIDLSLIIKDGQEQVLAVEFEWLGRYSAGPISSWTSKTSLRFSAPFAPMYISESMLSEYVLSCTSSNTPSTRQMVECLRNWCSRY